MFQIVGGVALILFGVRSLRKNLDRLFGASRAAWLQGAIRTRWRAFGEGCAIARLAPASTTVALLSLDVMRTGRVPPERTLAGILGANVGITINEHPILFTLLDPVSLPIPALALAQASREILLVADKALFALLTTANELASGGDIIDKNLCNHLINHLDGHFTIPVAVQTQRKVLQDHLVTRFTLGFLTTRDPDKATTFLESKTAFDRECRAAQTEHFARLANSDRATLEASAFFLDCVTSYRRINGHLAILADTFARPKPSSPAL